MKWRKLTGEDNPGFGWENRCMFYETVGGDNPRDYYSIGHIEAIYWHEDENGKSKPSFDFKDEGGGPIRATHWMELPKPPES